jgi:periplasmic protein TonB
MNRSWILAALLAAACDVAPAEPVQQPEPIPGESPFIYPVDLWDRKVQGETTLLLHVTEVGDVDSVRVDATSGFVAFDSAAVHGAWAMRFSPARQGDRRVAAWTRVPVRFSMDTLAAKTAADTLSNE